MKGARRHRLRRPFVLLHFPPIFLAIASASAILVAAATAAPLFRSVTGTAAVGIGLGAHTDEALAISRSGPLAADVLELRDRAVRAAAASLGDLGTPDETLSGSKVTLRADRATTTARMATRTGFATHAEILGGDAQATGLWLTDAAATRLGVGVGDRVTVVLGDRTLEEPVGAIYAAPRSQLYWSDLLSTVGHRTQPASLVLVDRRVFLAVETELQDGGEQTWTFPLGPTARQGLTLDRAVDLADGIEALDRTSSDPTTEFGSALDSPSVISPVIDAVRAAQAGRRTITPPIQTLALTGGLVAMFGMVAAGAYGVRRRRIEVRWLDAKGVTWPALWSRAAAEGALPVVAGGAVGWTATRWAIPAFGPSSILEPEAIGSSVAASVAAATIAILVLTTVTTVSARRQAREDARGVMPSRRAAPLWEVPTLVLAAAALYEIWTRGTSVVSLSDGEVRVDQLLLLFPVLFMAGSAGLAVRAFGQLLVRVRGSERWPMWLFLAARRVASAPRVAMLMVTAATLATGVLAYAGTAVTTIRESTRDKILVSAGSDVTASTAGPIFPPAPGSGLATTNVLQLPRVTTGEGDLVTLVGIEPESFADAAFWDDAFSSRPLAALVGELASGQTGPLPAVVAGGGLGDDPALDLAGYRLPIEVVGTTSAFPGQRQGHVVVVSAPRLRSVLDEHGASVALRGASYEAWARGPTDLARAFLLSSGADPNSVQVAGEQLQTPGYRSLAWSFVFMEMVGVVTAVIALIGLLLYLQARQRARELAYALARRMGLSSRAHRLAVAAEIAGLLVSAYAIGSALAIAAAALVFRRLDPLPELPPAPMLRAPVAILVWMGVAIVACAGAGAWLVQRRAERADVGAVLRFAE